jgi:CRP/FNR family transcriptional regulator, cyclic AMP receptor protein
MTSDAGVSPSSVQSVRKDLSRRLFPAGATIFSEGDAGTVAYVLLRVNVTVIIGLGTSRQRTVTEVKPGEMFGVHALMADAQRMSSAVTPDGCELLAVSEAKLKQKLDEADPFVRYWVEYLSKRVIDLSAP